MASGKSYKKVNPIREEAGNGNHPAQGQESYLATIPSSAPTKDEKPRHDGDPNFKISFMPLVPTFPHRFFE